MPVRKVADFTKIIQGDFGLLGVASSICICDVMHEQLIQIKVYVEQMNFQALNINAYHSGPIYNIVVLIFLLCLI